MIVFVIYVLFVIWLFVEFDLSYVSVILYALLTLLVINILPIARVAFKAFLTKRARTKTALQRNKQIPFNKAAGSEHILVIGDSTMHGYGAEKPKNTIGGLLSVRYPKASIETVAINGARLHDLPQQFTHAKHEHYKLMFLGIGGNDVMRMTSFKDIESHLEEFLLVASARADRIILVHSVNLGNTGVFAFPLNRLFDYRTRRLSQIYERVAANFEKVHYVSFYRPLGKDFYNSPRSRAKFIASDGFHPSDYANRFFFAMTEEFLP